MNILPRNQYLIMCAHTRSSSLPLETETLFWGKKKMSAGFLGLNDDIKKAPVIPVTSGTAKVPLRAQQGCVG